MVALAVVLALCGAEIVVPQETGPPVASAEVGSPSDRKSSGQGLETERGTETESPAQEAELQRSFNELRRELLDERGRSIDNWLTVIALVLTFFGVVVAIAGLWAYRRFSDIEADAKDSAGAAAAHEEKAREVLQRITQHKAESEGYLRLIRGMTAEGAQDKPREASRAAEAIRENPKASVSDRAIAQAVSFQNQGRPAEAIKLWRALAVTAEGIDNELAARAWFSSAFLFGNRRPSEAIGDYDEAIRVKPDSSRAYNNRANAKAVLGRYEEAIADYDEAIRLDPGVGASLAYSNRGNAKAALGRYEEAVSDHDEAIRLDPGRAEALNNRGSAKAGLGQYQGAIADHDEAIRLKPDDAVAYSNRGNAKTGLGHYQEAIADLDEAIRLGRPRRGDPMRQSASARTASRHTTTAAPPRLRWDSIKRRSTTTTRRSA